jgi:D-alanyl-D-alanine carboxypeptidase
MAKIMQMQSGKAGVARPLWDHARMDERAMEPSMRQFSAWLDVFNSGDRERCGDFLADRFPSRLESLDKVMAFRERTGGLDLRKLERVSPTEAAALVQERDSDQFARVELTVEVTDPHVITALKLAAIPRPAEFPIARLTEADAITGIRDVLREATAADRFSGAVLVAKNGQVLSATPAGWPIVNAESRTPCRRDFASGR